MSLFDQLRRLYRKDKFPLEDFHTEIVAQVLRDSPRLTLSWLRALGVTQLSDTDDITVATQEDFEALEGHATGSRPDIAIRLSHGDSVELVLIESKVGAKEGPDQLKRYAEHLVSNTDVQRTGLVFITRDFETDRAFPLDPTRFTFRQTRWFEFFIILKAHVNDDGLARQLVSFMEENRMSIRNQFSAIDCVALENFLAAKSLMDETLWGEVSNDFAEKLGEVSTQKKAIIQLRDESRYIMQSSFGPGDDFVVMLGFWLPEEGPGDSVWVGLMLYSNPKSSIRNKVIATFRAFIQNRAGSWEHDLGDPKEWSSIYRGTSLPTFLGESDHLYAIKTYFLGLLSEVVEFREEHPDLPWTANMIEGGED